MTVLKAVTADLLANIGNTYDQTRTTIQGYVAAQTILGYPCLAPPLVKWVDIFSDSSGDVPVMMDYTTNGRLFAITLPTAGLARILCYTFDALTGNAVYIGKVVVTVPNQAATTYTLRGFKVDDTNPAAIEVFMGVSGSIVINGGLFQVNNLNITDFTQVGFPTIPIATGTNQKAVYFLQDPAAQGAAHAVINIVGVSIDRTAKKVYVHNGISATHQIYAYDYSLAPSLPSSTVTITIASPGVIAHAGHNFLAGDQVAFSTTGALPTGITAGTFYFIKNPVAGVSYEISLTTGGASINTSGTQSGVHSSYRGFGISTNEQSFRTGNLPALAGTLLQTNSERLITPAHTTNSGFPCIFFATSSALYLGKVSELSAGVTIWPSLVTSNLLGSTNQVTAPIAVIATWNEFLDRAVFTTSTTKIVAKKIVNNLIEDIYGVLNNDYLEGVVPSSVITQFGAITIGDFKQSNGWTFIVGATTGQRGVIALNTSQSYRNGTTKIVSKVLDTTRASILAGVAVANQLSGLSSSPRLSYRTSGFGSISGGWVVSPANNLLNGVVPGSQIQFMIEFDPSNTFLNNPTAATELYLAYGVIDQISDNWAGSVDNTSQNGASPAYTAFRMTKADSGTKYFRAYDDSGNLVVSANTSADFAMFDKTTNNGTSWSAMSGANDYSATPLTTEIRYKWASPPGVRVTCSLRDS